MAGQEEAAIIDELIGAETDRWREVEAEAVVSQHGGIRVGGCRWKTIKHHTELTRD